MKPRVIRMATTIDYIDGLLKEKGVSLKERCDITDKLISFEVFDEPIDEDKLDELADSVNPNSSHGDNYEVGQYYGFQDGFVAGYKAKEE